MFIVELFTRAKAQNQPWCLSMNECTKKMYYLHSGILLNCKEDRNPVIYTEMDGVDEFIK